MKILLVGDSGVGKTCLFTRFVRDKFNETKATVMPNGANRIIHSECETIDLEVWDTAGVHSSRTLTRAFYNGADGIIIAYDVTNIETFNSIKQWLCDIQSNGGRETPKVLLGNKCDLINEKKVETDAAKMFADNYGIKFYEVSAKTCLNVEKAFFDVVCEIRNRQKSNPENENYEIENRMTYNEKRDLIANLEI
ncbi:ras-related protein RABD2a-like protein, partial [Leptotrombidium deliense]